MKSMRWLAFGIGMGFGLLYLVLNLLDPDTFIHAASLSDWLLMITGPVTLVVASLAGLKFRRFAGWWLLVASIAAAVQFAFRTRFSPAVMLATVAIFCLPMALAGTLWLKSADTHDTKPSYFL